MRCIAYLAVLLQAHSAQGQEKLETYGKTEAQVLAMDLNKWEEFYSKNAGASTASTSEAYGTYAEIAKRRNNKMPHASRVVRLRELLLRYCTSSINIGQNITGGGTMWNPFYGNAAADVELVLYPILGGKAPRDKPATVSMVRRSIDKVAKAIEENHKDDSTSTYFKYADARSDLKAFRNCFGEIAKEAKGLPRADSDHVLQLCITWAGIALGNS